MREPSNNLLVMEQSFTSAYQNRITSFEFTSLAKKLFRVCVVFEEALSLNNEI